MMDMSVPADARRRMLRTAELAQRGRSARTKGSQDGKPVSVSINDAMALVITGGQLNPDYVPEYIGRTILQGMLNDAGCPCNRLELKQALEVDWRIRLRKTDRAPSTSDLREALADGRIKVGSPARSEFRARASARNSAETREEKVEIRNRVQRLLDVERSAIRADEDVIARATERLAYREALAAEMEALVDDLNGEVITPVVSRPDPAAFIGGDKTPNTAEN